VSLQDLVVERDRVVESHIARATHKGEFLGHSATGKKIHWTENHIYRLENGKIAEVWSEASFYNLLEQISS
jgi:predicted ester cyclase